MFKVKIYYIKKIVVNYLNFIFPTEIRSVTNDKF